MTITKRTFPQGGWKLFGVLRTTQGVRVGLGRHCIEIARAAR